jgi:hypothetical protein
MSIEQEFWGRVKYLIKLENATQACVASQIPVPADLFRRWASKGVMPNADQAAAIAKTLNTTVEYLVYGLDQKSDSYCICRSISPQMNYIIKLLQCIPDEQMDVLEIQIQALADKQKRN